MDIADMRGANMQKIYQPKKKVVIASSIEGVFNNGAKECGFISINALSRINPFFKKNTMDEFIQDKSVSDSKEMKAFLALRPLVKVAEDYYTVLQLIKNYPAEAEKIIESKDEKIVSFFEKRFEALKAATKAQREDFKKAFYDERDERKAESMEKWQLLQSPFIETVDEFRALHANGYILSFVTSKDEKSTYELCVAYSSPMAGYLKEEEVKPVSREEIYFMGSSACMITPQRIIGRERMPGKKDKAAQLDIIAKQENVSKGQVFRLDDMYNADEVKDMRQAGYENIIIVKGGYAFDMEYEKAQKDGILVVERENMAAAIANKAKELGL